MKKLNESSLQAGDIILTTTTHKVSAAIRAATRSDISHAMVYVESHSVIDATSEGVQARNTERILFDDNSAVYVLRPRAALSADQVAKVCRYVRERVGTSYSKTEAVRAVLGGASEWSKQQFCSRLVAQAYESIGVILVKDTNYCSPEDIKQSASLVVVENVTREMSEAEAAHWAADPDGTQPVRDSTNALLAGARLKSAGIESISDIDQHLIDHPEDDDYFYELYQKSGYLDVWKIQTSKNPQLYDLSIMKSLHDPTGQFDQYARDTLDDEAREPNRYVANRFGYSELRAAHPRRTFALKEELYEVLASLHGQRLRVARAWLKHRGLPAPTSGAGLRPHTPDWFANLELWNPLQAMMTREAIAASKGETEICSICADDPAADYRLAEEQRGMGAVDTLRLCDDCLGVRRGSGEKYESWSGN